MKLSRRISIPALAVFLGVLACEVPATATPAPADLNLLNTIVAGTVIAARTQSMVPGSPMPVETASGTFTPESPALTSTETATATITSTSTPIYTFTPLVPLISVSVATNCRSGPGKVYAYRGALLVGMSAEILARDPGGNYWYIRNPDSADNFCWVWGEYATITGNVLSLPIYTPPPTPSVTFTPLATLTPTPGPGIKISYTSMDSCAGWWVEFKLTNTGGINLRSVEIEVFDSDTHVTLTNLTDGFTDNNGCLTSTTKDVLIPENSTVVSAPAFAYDPSGHEIELTVTACSKTGQSGLCNKRKIEFIP